MKTLETIIKKYAEISFNEDNYSVGGGLADDAQTIDGECGYCGCKNGHYTGCARPKYAKFASRRHEDAKYDQGKLTYGKATQLFIKATGLSIEIVKEVINYAVPNMEYHHAGKLPKQYGGGMKKTYFVNAKEVVYIASNWADLLEKVEIAKNERRIAAENEKTKQQIELEFLQKNATKVVRVSKVPEFFYETDREMNGKYGWFSSYGKSYNMPEYYTGWAFESIEKKNEFMKL